MKLFSCCIENDAASRVLSVVAQSIQSQGVNFVSKRVNFVSNPTVALQSTLLYVQCWRAPTAITTTDNTFSKPITSALSSAFAC